MATQLQYRHIPWQIETFQVYIYVFLQPERYQDIIKPSNMLLKYWKFLSFLSLFVCVCVCVFVWQGLTSIVPAGHKFKIHLHQPLHCCDYTCVSLFQEQQQKFLRNWFVCVHTCVCVCVCMRVRAHWGWNPGPPSCAAGAVLRGLCFRAIHRIARHTLGPSSPYMQPIESSEASRREGHFPHGLCRSPLKLWDLISLGKSLPSSSFLCCCCIVLCFSSSRVGTKPRISHMLGKHSVTVSFYRQENWSLHRK
jgi:hypothetical protein